MSYQNSVFFCHSGAHAENQASRKTEHVVNQVYDVGTVQHCMTKSIRHSALLALICTAIPLSYLSATDPAKPGGPQDAVAGQSVDNPNNGPVSTLVEYSCKKGIHHKAARTELVSVVMQRGADTQPIRMVGVKDSKTSEVAFVYVLESDCSGERPVAAQGAASLALAHKTHGEDKYFYAISGQAECLRAFRLRFLGQFDAVDMSTRMQDCQNEVRTWLSQAAKWKAQATSAGDAKH